MTTAALFAVSLILIVAAAELFTNAVEWAGYRLHLASGATGSLLAALGTALPETVVPVVALVAGAPGSNEVAMGAVLGAPFLLLTLGVAVTGVAILGRPGERHLAVDRGQVRRDLGVFIVAFAFSVGSVLLPAPARHAVGICLLGLYGGYVRATLRGSAPSQQSPEPLHLVRRRPGEPGMGVVCTQLALAVAMLIGGSELFVRALDRTASVVHFSPLVLAIVLVPIATELPETFNSVLWVRSRDDTLAFGNVAGSATFQACILGFIGLNFTSWTPGRGGLLGAGLTGLTAVYLLAVLRSGTAHGGWLVGAALPWIAYVAGELTGLIR